MLVVLPARLVQVVSKVPRYKVALGLNMALRMVQPLGMEQRDMATRTITSNNQGPGPKQVMTTRVAMSNSQALGMELVMTTRMMINQAPGPRQALAARQVLGARQIPEVMEMAVIKKVLESSSSLL